MKPGDGAGARQGATASRPRTRGTTSRLFIDTELTLAPESPLMVPLDLGGAEDEGVADALAAIDGAVA